MQSVPPRFQLNLEDNASLTLPDAADVGIECRGGTVWITLDGDPRDIVLAPGERFQGSLHRRALVTALGPSCIAVSGSRPAALPVPRRERAAWWRLAPGLAPA